MKTRSLDPGGPAVPPAVLLTAPFTRRAVLGTFAAVGLAACGGGGDGIDSGGTGGAPTQQSFTNGSITGFGSIIVNGVRFDDSQAVIVDDEGRSRGRGDLALGMVVDIDAGAIATDAVEDKQSGVARRIEFASEIRGPVQSVDAAGGTFVALGQTVRVDADTVFHDLANGLASVRAGQLVEVYAFFDESSGSYSATRIERHTAMTSYKLRGPVAKLDAGARRFSIGGLTISYAGVPAAGLPALADGTVVRISLNPDPQGSVWLALDARPRERRLDEGVEATLEGFVRDFAGAGSFTLNGVAVDASGDVRFRGGDRSQLVEGARIHVDGEIRGGVLVAQRIDIKRRGGGGEDFELEGRIATYDRAAGTFELQGITVAVDARTHFVRGRASDLAVGRRVEVRGVLSGAGERLLATRIKFDR